MSSFVDNSHLTSSKLENSKDQSSKDQDDDQDLFPHNNTLNENRSDIENEKDLNIHLEHPYITAKSKGNSSNRKYRKQSK